jgi:OOP family OmpA-OmpF porin
MLDEAADALSSDPSTRYYINGYADLEPDQSSDQARELSRRRAEAVALYLEDKGIAADRLVVQGFGQTHFIATNETPEGRAENRRVEIVPSE